MAKLYFKYGAMGSSKSAQALITQFNYEELGMSVWLIKPSIDTRDGADIVRSRIGLMRSAQVITPEQNIAEAFRADCEKQKEYFVSNGFPAPEALAYPGGIYSELAESILHGQCGILATFTTEEGGTNILERGKPESLYLLYRYNLMDSISNESILEYLK